jgi:hypothetical protein
MNLPVAACIENARKRPWEPHKYASKAEQDKNLDRLIDVDFTVPHAAGRYSPKPRTGRSMSVFLARNA